MFLADTSGFWLMMLYVWLYYVGKSLMYLSRNGYNLGHAKIGSNDFPKSKLCTLLVTLGTRNYNIAIMYPLLIFPWFLVLISNSYSMSICYQDSIIISRRSSTYCCFSFKGERLCLYRWTTKCGFPPSCFEMRAIKFAGNI